MNKANASNVRLLAGALVVAAVAVYVIRRNLPSMPSLSDYVPEQETVRSGVGDGIGHLGGYVSAVGVGAVEGLGLAVGIPRTNVSQCQADKAAGRWWDASFSCTATDFVSSGAAAIWPSTGTAAATQADVRRVDNAIDYRDPANPFVNESGMDFRYF